MKIDCKKIANELCRELKQELTLLKENYCLKPKIVIIKVGQNIQSDKYIDIKKRKAAELGVEVQVITNLKTPIDLINCLQKLNLDQSVHGYILQLPLPKQFKITNILPHIAFNKDLDGISLTSIAENVIGVNDNTIQPATAKAIMKVIASKKYSLKGKHVVIVNRSLIIGKPISQLLLNEGATVTICHSQTKQLSTITSMADVLITAIGSPNFFRKRMIKKNAFVIDAGISYVCNKPFGDIDTKQIETQAKYFSTTPNGVGQITVAMLFYNLVTLLKKSLKIN